MKIGVAIPQVAFDSDIDFGLVRSYIERAEDFGFASLWVMEMGVTANDRVAILDSLSLLAYAASLTKEPSLGTAVLLTGLRDPLWLAKTIATIDQMSAGRTIIGVGLGDRNRTKAFGVSSSDRVPRFEESLSLLRSLWADGPTTFSGAYWSLNQVEMYPKPIQRPHPPIWFGAHQPTALRRAARFGDGWMGAGASSSPVFAQQVRQIKAFLGEYDHEIADFVISKRVYMAIDTDRFRAESRVRNFFDGLYSDPNLGLECAIVGSPDHCISELERLRSYGADLVVINPMYDYPRQLELFGHVLLPALG